MLQTTFSYKYRQLSMQKHICTKFSSCAYTQTYTNRGIFSLSVKNNLLQWTHGPLCFAHFCGVVAMYLSHVNTQYLLQTLTWLRWLPASLSPQRPRFNSTRFHVVFVRNKMALRKVFHQVPRFSCHCYSTSAPHSFIHISPIPHNHSFIHFITNITQC